jgi:tRNA G18 (ribose-2'-O)-methylase SpoU
VERTLLVFGLHACAATLKRAAHEVLELWIRRDAGDELQAMADQASALGVVVQRVTYQLVGLLVHVRSARATGVAAGGAAATVRFAVRLVTAPRAFVTVTA